MYKNIITELNNYFDEQLNKFTTDIAIMTNNQCLELWYYRERLTQAAATEVKNSNPESLLSETVKKKMVKRFTTENEKSRARYMNKLERAEQATAPATVTITVAWHKNRTWGMNPTAEVIGERIRTTGTASGCGYDKESAAIASAFNDNPEIMKILYNHAENGGEFAYSVHKFAGVPWFDGGCGVSCFRSVFEKCGYKFIDISHSKTFDVYQITKEE